jgi:hypothetical protein
MRLKVAAVSNRYNEHIKERIKDTCHTVKKVMKQNFGGKETNSNETSIRP